MERVANNMVSETPVLEGAALEELKALLDLQTKMFLEALDECFAAREAKWDAMFARSGARTRGGSGVLDAAVAQEVTADLDRAAAATSITDAEPGDINTGALTSCSTKFPNLVVDVAVPVPVCIVAEEVVPNLVPAAAASSATNTERSDINIGTPSSCSMEFPNLVIDAATLVPMRTVTAEVIPDSDHVTAVTSAIYVEPSAVFDELDATAAMSGHNYDMATRHQASATSTTIDKDLFLDPVLAADASSAVGIELSTIHIGMPITCSTKCRSVFIDITDAASAVYATAEEVTLDLTTGCITIVLFDGPDIIVDAGLPAYWMDILVMLETSSEVSVLNSWFSLDWVELQQWPPPAGLEFITDAPVLRPLPWPSFASGIPNIQIRYFCLAPAQGNLVTNYQYACLSHMGFLGFLKIGREQQQNGCTEILRYILTAEFHEVIFDSYIVDHCAAISLLVDIFSGAPITVLELLAWLGCDLIAEPVQCGDTLAVGPALFLGLKPPWPPPARHNFRIMHVDLPMTSLSAQQLGVDARKEVKCSEDFLAMCCAEEMLDYGINTRSSVLLIASCTDLLKAQKMSAIFTRINGNHSEGFSAKYPVTQRPQIILLTQQKCGGVCELPDHSYFGYWQCFSAFVHKARQQVGFVTLYIDGNSIVQSIREHEQVILALWYWPALILGGTLASAEGNKILNKISEWRLFTLQLLIHETCFNQAWVNAWLTCVLWNSDATVQRLLEGKLDVKKGRMSGPIRYYHLIHGPWAAG